MVRSMMLLRIAIGIIGLGITMILLLGIGLYQNQPIVDCAYPHLRISAWVDANADSQRQPVELPLPGVVVEIPGNYGY